MISLRVPATTANLGPGFDSFGLALKLYNRFEFTPADRDQLYVLPGTCVDVNSLSLNPAENLIFQAIEHYYKDLGETRPALEVGVGAHIPLARGLGSSSTAIVAGISAANILVGSPMNRQELLQLAIKIEGHPDNVAPALLGGCLLCDDTDAYRLPWPEDWHVLIVVPEKPLPTKEARAVMPSAYPLDDAVYSLRKASLLTYSLLQADEQAFTRCLEDKLHQPYRGPLIPEFMPVKTAAQEAGAFGTVISGAGSSLAIFYPETRTQPLCSALNTLKEQQYPHLRLLPLGIDTQGVCTAESY